MIREKPYSLSDLSFIDDASIYNSRDRIYTLPIHNENDLALTGSTGPLGFNTTNFRLGSAAAFHDSLKTMLTMYPQTKTVEETIDYESKLFALQAAWLDKAIPHCSGYIELGDPSLYVRSCNLAQHEIVHPVFEVVFTPIGSGSIASLYANDSQYYNFQINSSSAEFEFTLYNAGETSTITGSLPLNSEWIHVRGGYYNSQLFISLTEGEYNSSTTTTTYTETASEILSNFELQYISLGNLCSASGSWVAPVGSYAKLKAFKLWNETSEELESNIEFEVARSSWADDALVVNYKFNEGMSLSLSEYLAWSLADPARRPQKPNLANVKTVYDYSGNGNHGVFYGTLTDDNTGQILHRVFEYISGSAIKAWGPFIDYPTIPIWFTAPNNPVDDVLSAFFNDCIQDAIEYDKNNRSVLYKHIPLTFLEQESPESVELFLGMMGLLFDDLHRDSRNNIEGKNATNSDEIRPSTNRLVDDLKSRGFDTSKHLQNFDIFTRKLLNNVDYSDARRAVLLRVVDQISDVNLRKGRSESLDILARSYGIPPFLYAIKYFEEEKLLTSYIDEYFEYCFAQRAYISGSTEYSIVARAGTSGSTLPAAAFGAQFLFTSNPHDVSQTGTYVRFDVGSVASGTDGLSVGLVSDSPTKPYNMHFEAYAYSASTRIPLAPNVYTSSSFTRPSNIDEPLMLYVVKDDPIPSSSLRFVALYPKAGGHEVLLDETYEVPFFNIGVESGNFPVVFSSDAGGVVWMGYDNYLDRTLESVRRAEFDNIWRPNYGLVYSASTTILESTLNPDGHRYEFDWSSDPLASGSDAYVGALVHKTATRSNLDIARTHDRSLNRTAPEINPNNNTYVEDERKNLGYVAQLTGINFTDYSTLPYIEYNTIVNYVSSTDIDLEELAMYTLAHFRESPSLVIENPSVVRNSIPPFSHIGTSLQSDTDPYTAVIS